MNLDFRWMSLEKFHIIWEGPTILRNRHSPNVVMFKSTVEILQNFVAFSEYMNFTKILVEQSSSQILI